MNRMSIAILFALSALALSCEEPRGADEPHEAPTTDRAQKLSRSGAKAYNSGDMPGAVTSWEQSLAVFKKIPGTGPQQAKCYKNIGLALRQMGKHEASIAKQEQALAMYEGIPGTDWHRAHCRVNIGLALGDMGKHEEAIAKYEEALAIYRQIPGRAREQADCYRNIAEALRRLGKYEAAIAKLREALAMYRRIPGTDAEQAACRTALSQLGSPDEPREARMESARLLYNRGMKAYKNGDISGALAFWKRALAIFTRIPGTDRERAVCYKNIGVALDDMGKYEEAIAKQEQALAIYMKIPGTERDRADCYMNIGAALGRMGKYEEAIAKQEQALAIYARIPGTERERARCYGNIGVALESMGKYEEAIAKQKQALAIYMKIPGTERNRANCYVNTGAALGSMGKYEEVIAKHEQALAIYMKIPGTERDRARCHVGIGVALESMGKYEEAIAKQAQALAIFTKIPGTDRERATCYMNTGLALERMGKHEDAIAKQAQALAIFTKIPGTDRERAGCYMNIGLALERMGKYEEAIAKQAQALAIYTKIPGTDRDRADCYKNIGAAFRKIGKYEASIAKHEQALAIYNKIAGTEVDRGSCKASIGLAHLGARRFSQAIAVFEAARRAGRAWWLSQGLANAYRWRRRLGDEQKAVDAFVSAMALAEIVRGRVFAFEHRAGVFEEPSQVFRDFVGFLADSAARKVRVEQEEVIRWAEDPRSAGAMLEAAFHFGDRGKSRALTDAMRERATLKSARADTKVLAEDRSLSLQISKLSVLRLGLAPKQSERREALTRRIEGLQQRRNMIEAKLKRTTLGRYVLPEDRKPMEMARDLGARTAVLQYSIAERDRWLLVLTRDGVSAHRLDVKTAALPELLARQEATVKQLVSAWRDRPGEVGLDGLVRLARIRVEDLGWPKQQKKKLIDARQERAILERLGQAALPEGALKELRGKGIAHLVVIPDGSLHYVPFAMLRVGSVAGEGKRFLVEEFSISYVPAMTTLEAIRHQKRKRQQQRRGGRGSVLAFANPAYGGQVAPGKDEMTTRVRSIRGEYYRESGLVLTSLPETEQEAVRVASLFGPIHQYRQPGSDRPEGVAVVYTGRGACEQQVKRLLGVGPDGKSKPGWRYVLFSAHGLADTYNGMLSCVALSSPSSGSTEDGFLQAQEVLDMSLDTEMVMLSACQTGLGRMRSGEGLVGLSASFFCAGAESVCASMWRVPTGPTVALTTEMFRRLKGGKISRAEALRQAQIELLRRGRGSEAGSSKYAEPFCWAAFVLLGDAG